MLLAAYNYPLLNIFWTMLWVFAFVIWLWLLFSVFADIFRSHDMRGLAKALWVLFVVVIPFFGVLMYLVVRGGGMHERQEKMAQAQRQAMNDYIKQTAGGSGGVADELSKLSELHDSGVLSDAEYEQQKKKALASG
jgi:hypothetical protein